MGDVVLSSAASRLRDVEWQINALVAERDALLRVLRADGRLQGGQLGEAARRELEANGSMHYADLAVRLGVGAPKLLTTLHRHPGVRQDAPRSGLWRAA